MKSAGETLVKQGIITAKESAKFESLAKDVSRYLETTTPSLYRRDEFDKMFE